MFRRIFAKWLAAVPIAVRPEKSDADHGRTERVDIDDQRIG